MIMSDKAISVDGVLVPRFLYGTAWKEDHTERLVGMALRAGFRGIDTANQRKHYHEAQVGAAISTAISDGLVTRSDVFLQTKFTFQHGQDHRLPYDLRAPISKQVEQSFASSLEHLGTDHVESYVLHGPSVSTGLSSDDWEAWRAMESIYDRGQTRLLGISNVSLGQLQLLVADARVKLRFVQNRCYASRNWDQDVRRFCAENEILYQGFSLLTANQNVLASREMKQVAKDHNATPAQIIFRFALDIGMLPLTGTTSAKHMQADLDCFDLELTPEEIEQIKRV